VNELLVYSQIEIYTIKLKPNLLSWYTIYRYAWGGGQFFRRWKMKLIFYLFIRVSPASSSSAISGTPSSGSRFTDMDRLERVQSFLRDEEDDKVHLHNLPSNFSPNAHFYLYCPLTVFLRPWSFSFLSATPLPPPPFLSHRFDSHTSRPFIVETVAFRNWCCLRLFSVHFWKDERVQYLPLD